MLSSRTGGGVSHARNVADEVIGDCAADGRKPRRRSAAVANTWLHHIIYCKVDATPIERLRLAKLLRCDAGWFFDYTMPAVPPLVVEQAPNTASAHAASEAQSTAARVAEPYEYMTEPEA